LYKEGRLKENKGGKERGLKCLNDSVCLGSGIRPSWGKCGEVSFYLCSILNRLERGKMKEISEKKLHTIRITYKCYQSINSIKF